jgi:hypothetical protein
VPDGSSQFGLIDLPSPNATNGSAEFFEFGFSWNSDWRYDDAGADRGTAWREPAFNDSTWSQGTGPLGNENEPMAVPIETEIELGNPTYYFRKKYVLPEDVSLADVQASISTEVDDGFVIYVNGRELVRRGMRNGAVSYDDLANRDVNEAAIEGPFSVPIDYLVPGENVFAAEVHQTRLDSSDFVFGMSFDARVPLPQSIPTTALADSLRITELMYHSPDGLPHEYIELQNISSNSVNVEGVRLSGGVDFVFPNVTILPNERVVVAEDAVAFLRHYGQGANLVGQYSGQLADAGEELALLLPEPYETAILRFDYSDDWYSTTDGQGFSLEIVDPKARFDRWGQQESWRASASAGGTPGYAPGQSPFAPSMVINEVLTHTDPPQVDSIELHNRSTLLVGAGSWYLTDSESLAAKFTIPVGTFVAPGGYVVFDETDFNSSPGTNPDDFALSSYRGEQLWLWATHSNGDLARIVDTVEFGAAANGESFGRFPNAQGPLYPMTSVTLGSGNSSPRVGPVVISEINYHPADPTAAALAIDPNIRDDDLEFIEIYNPTAAGITLTNWRMRGGIDYDFPAGTTLPAGQSLLVASFAPSDPNNRNRLSAFRTNYAINDQVRILGPYTGKLDNGSNQVQLQRPDEPPLEEPTFIPRLLEDEVIYDDDGAWPTSADGQGNSLTRLLPARFGNEASSWNATAPTPGRVLGSNLPGDLNGDATVNEQDITLLCQSINGTRPPADLNADGATNRSDLHYLIETILRTEVGDANLDGVFNSGDFVAVFQAGEYEDNAPRNSTWSEGDWNCDADFSTGDLVEAFQRGGYTTAAVARRDTANESHQPSPDERNFAHLHDVAVGFPASSARTDNQRDAAEGASRPRAFIADTRRGKRVDWIDARLADQVFVDETTRESFEEDHDDLDVTLRTEPFAEQEL